MGTAVNTVFFILASAIAARRRCRIKLVHATYCLDTRRVSRRGSGPRLRRLMQLGGGPFRLLHDFFPFLRSKSQAACQCEPQLHARDQ